MPETALWCGRLLRPAEPKRRGAFLSQSHSPMLLIQAYIRLLKAIVEAFTHQSVLVLMSVNAILVSLAATVYYHLESWSYADAVYFSVITISTVGYGEVTPTTIEGKLFTVVYIFVGVGLFVLAVGAFADHVIKYIREHRS